MAYRKASEENPVVALGSEDFWAAVQDGGDVRVSVGDILVWLRTVLQIEDVNGLRTALDAVGATAHQELQDALGAMGGSVSESIAALEAVDDQVRADLKAVSDSLGTAAGRNTGTAQGQVPLLGAGGKLDASTIPAVAITDTFPVASQAAMLASGAERGDIAIRSDLNRCFILQVEPATALANWKELLTPTDAILSVAGLTGAITAGALKTALGIAVSDVSGLQGALDALSAADTKLRTDFQAADTQIRTDFAAADTAVRGEFKTADDAVRQAFAAADTAIRTDMSAGLDTKLNTAGGTITGTLGFGYTLGHRINLWGTNFAVGVQNNTAYVRTGTEFAVHAGGAHSENQGDAGTGGTNLLRLSSSLFTYKGQTIWNAGNFDPATKATLGASASFSALTVSARPTWNGLTPWDSGNFNPATKATLGVGSAVGFGDVTADRGNGAGGVIFFGNTGTRYLQWDGANYIMPGANLVVNGSEVSRQHQFHAATGYGFTSRNTYVYADPGTDNLVVRTGNATAGYRYATFGTDGLFSAGSIRASGSLYATDRVIVGEGQSASYIEMRDTDDQTRYLHNNGGSIGFLNKDAGWALRVFDDGNVWTPAFGYFSDKFAYKINPVIGNGVRIEANGGAGTAGVWPALSLVHAGIEHWQTVVSDIGQLSFRNGDTGSARFVVGRDGAVWTSQFGDLNSRIEDRAAAYAAARVAKTGDTMTGDLTITKTYPSVRMLYPGVRDVAWQVRENGGTYLWDFSAGTWNLYIGPSGEVSTRQLGDLNQRIEDRARAYAEDRAGGRVWKGGDTMTGELTLQANPPQLRMNNTAWGNRWIRVDTSGTLVFLKSDTNYSHSFDNAGNIWSAAYGNLHDYIDGRVNNKSARLVHAGDLDWYWNQTARNYDEPYWGAVMTSRASGPSVGTYDGFRWRYLQMSDAAGNWYSCGY